MSSSLASLRNSFDDREDSLSAFDPFLTENDPTAVGTENGEDTTGNWTLAAALGGGLFNVGAASLTWKSYMAMQATKAAKDANFQSPVSLPVIPLLGDATEFLVKTNLSTALEKVQRGGDVTKLMEFMPYIGTPVKRLNIDALWDAVEDGIKNLQKAMDASNKAIEESNAKLTQAHNISKAIFGVSATITGLSVVGTSLLTDYVSRSENFLDEDTDSETSSLALVETAFAEFSMRSDLSLGQFDETVEKVNQFVDDLPDFDGLMTLMAGIGDFASPLQGVLKELNTLTGPYEDFLGIVSVLEAPIAGILDIFESPPKILPTITGYKTITEGFWDPITTKLDPLDLLPDLWIPAVKVPIFGTKELFDPIPRSEIQKIIDLIIKIAGTPAELLDTLLSPILKPIESTINKLLQPIIDKINPFSDYIDDFDLASEIFADLSALMDTIQAKFNELLAALPDFDFDLSPIAEIGLYDTAGMSTFLGTDGDEVLKGVESALAESVMEGAILQGNGGDDKITGTGKNDLLGGGSGNDVIKGLSGDDVIYGNSGNDILNGGNGNDVIDGGSGYDIAQFLNADYDEFSFKETDEGFAFSRKVGNETETDLLYGIEEFQFQDQTKTSQDLFGVSGDAPEKQDEIVEVLEGGSSDDLLSSGAGRAAFMKGGGGADVFEFKSETKNGEKEIDVVEDFELNVDLVRIAQSEVAEVRQTGGGVMLVLSDDGDAIYLRNDGLDLQDLSSIMEAV